MGPKRPGAGRAANFPATFWTTLWAALPAALLTALLAPPVSAHCPGSSLSVTLDTLREGVTVQHACYPVTPAVCIVDTFHLDEFKLRLSQEFRDKRYAVFGYVDAVEHYQSFDSVYYRGELYYIDTIETERVHLRIEASLKDSLPVRRLTFEERLPGIAFETTYRPLLDTPFVAFFDDYDTLGRMGIGPMDGCFFEPTGWFIHGGAIHRKGLPGDRMGGLSLPMEEFFLLLGLDPVPVPPVSILSPPGRPAIHPLRGAYRYDPIGRRLRDGGVRGPDRPALSFPDTRRRIP